MSRERFRAREKTVQKLGRDGLVEQNRATGEEQRVSQRAADVSFRPDRPAEPTQGQQHDLTPRQHKQPRPTQAPELTYQQQAQTAPTPEYSPPPYQPEAVPDYTPPPYQSETTPDYAPPPYQPEAPPETVPPSYQPSFTTVTDSFSESGGQGTFPAADAPSMRGAVDTPIFTPPPSTPFIDTADRSKRHRGHQSGHTQQPVHIGEDTSSRPAMPQDAARGRLHFEASHGVVESDTRTPTRKQRLPEDSTAPEDVRQEADAAATATEDSVSPSDVRPGRLEYGGRLQFGAKREPAAPDQRTATKKRQTRQFAADAAKPELAEQAPDSAPTVRGGDTPFQRPAKLADEGRGRLRYDVQPEPEPSDIPHDTAKAAKKKQSRKFSTGDRTPAPPSERGTAPQRPRQNDRNRLQFGKEAEAPMPKPDQRTAAKKRLTRQFTADAARPEQADGAEPTVFSADTAVSERPASDRPTGKLQFDHGARMSPAASGEKDKKSKGKQRRTQQTAADAQKLDTAAQEQKEAPVADFFPMSHPRNKLQFESEQDKAPITSDPKNKRRQKQPPPPDAVNADKAARAKTAPASEYAPVDHPRGKLQFETEPPKAAVVPDRKGKRQQKQPLPPDAVTPDAAVQSKDASVSAHSTVDRPRDRLHFESEPDTVQPEEPFTRRKRPKAEAGDTVPPSKPPSDAVGSKQDAQLHRQQKKVEKSERRVEQAAQRLENARAAIPKKRRLRIEREPDGVSGKVRRRLKFEEEPVPEYVPSSVPKRVGGALAHTASVAVIMKTHQKIRETERQNVAVEAAHKGEILAEQGAGRFLRWNKRRLREKPYRAVRKAEQALAKERANLAWRTTLRCNPELQRKGAIAKWIQKQKIKRKYAQAAREIKQTQHFTQNVLNAVGKIARIIQQYAAAHKAVFAAVALLAVVILFFAAGMTSCTAMLSGIQSSYISASYMANEEDICESDLYYTEMETDLEIDIDETETNYPGYDEYRYNIGEISHSPYELLGYLSTVHDAFTFAQVKADIERLFNEQYTLTRTVITETRYDSDDDPYDWYVLQTTLTVRPLSAVIADSLSPGEQTERYGVYMQTLGNRQAFGNPFSFGWLGYVSSSYGYRVHPITGVKNLHRGVDIAVASGTPIQAIHDGRVVSAGDAGSYGLCVVIEDDEGYQSRYAHCSALSVTAGQEVHRGDVIAAVGSTGDSTGPHLHLEIKLDGEYLNPYFFVDTGGGGLNGGAGGALPGSPGGVTIPDYSGEPLEPGTFAAMLNEAEKYLGMAYVWGGSSPSTGFDCSGYVSWVINHSGWNVGRLGAQGLYNICTPVSSANVQPGDLVFFWHTYSAPNPNGVTHVGIYVGNGKFIHCGDPISYANLNSNYWQEHFYGFTRLPSVGG